MGLDVVRNGDFDKVEVGHPCPMDIVLVYWAMILIKRVARISKSFDLIPFLKKLFL